MHRCSARRSTAGSSPTTDLHGTPAIIPSIRGRAWITGTTELYVDPDDPFPEGYVLTDTWPGRDVQ